MTIQCSGRRVPRISGCVCSPDRPGRADRRMLGRMRRRIVSESKTRQLMKGSWARTGDNDVVNLRRLSILSYPITCPGSRSRPAASPGRAVSFSDWDGQDLQRLLGMAHVVPRLQRRVRLGGRLRLGRGLRARSRLRVGPHALAKGMLEGLPYVALLLLLLLLLLVLFLILLFIFLFLLCASRLSTRQSKVDGTLVDHHRSLPGSALVG